MIGLIGPASDFYLEDVVASLREFSVNNENS